MGGGWSVCTCWFIYGGTTCHSIAPANKSLIYHLLRRLYTSMYRKHCLYISNCTPSQCLVQLGRNALHYVWTGFAYAWVQRGNDGRIHQRHWLNFTHLKKKKSSVLSLVRNVCGWFELDWYLLYKSFTPFRITRILQYLLEMLKRNVLAWPHPHHLQLFFQPTDLMLSFKMNLTPQWPRWCLSSLKHTNKWVQSLFFRMFL